MSIRLNPTIHSIYRCLRLALLGGCLMLIACQAHDNNWQAPFVYKQDIKQGNIITQATLDKLISGMTKKQVLFVMGSPTIIDPFHADRWIYLYLTEPSLKPRTQQRLSLLFEQDNLIQIAGNVEAGTGARAATDYNNKDAYVTKSSQTTQQSSFWRRWWNKLTSW